MVWPIEASSSSAAERQRLLGRRRDRRRRDEPFLEIDTEHRRLVGRVGPRAVDQLQQVLVVDARLARRQEQPRLQLLDVRCPLRRSP